MSGGRQRVVRHGTGPKRDLQTGIGPIPVQRHNVRDRDAGPERRRILFQYLQQKRSLPNCPDFLRKQPGGDHLRQVMQPVEGREVSGKGLGKISPAMGRIVKS